jgi:hypothetical protein
MKILLLKDFSERKRNERNGLQEKLAIEKEGGKIMELKVRKMTGQI